MLPNDYDGRDDRRNKGDNNNSNLGNRPKRPRIARPRSAEPYTKPLYNSTEKNGDRPSTFTPWPDRARNDTQTNTNRSGNYQNNRDSRPSNDGGYQNNRDSRPPREGGYQSNRDSRPPREGGYQSNRDSRPPREGGYQSNRDSRPPREGGYQSNRDSRPPREGGYQSNRDSRPPREGGYQRNSENRPPRIGGYDSGSGYAPRRDDNSTKPNASNPNFRGNNRTTENRFGNSNRPTRTYDRPNEGTAFGNRTTNSSFESRARAPYNREEGNSNSYGDRRPAYDPNRNSRQQENSGRYGQRQNSGFGRGNANGGFDKKPYNPYGRPSGRMERTNQDGLGKRAPYSLEKPYLEEPSNDGSIRLNRFIANAGICSRRKADDLIAEGKVQVNGITISEMGFKVNPSDTITLDGKQVKREKLIYVLLNKPKDFITTMDDPEERKTVMQLIKSATEERVFPIGRLDRNTTGLLLFSNDGDLSMRLTHPSNHISKIYHTVLDKPLTRDHMNQIAAGIQLEDGLAQVDAIAYPTEDKHEVGIEIHSGKNRIVRRIFESLGYRVEKLDRVSYAGLTKKDLPRGHWRYLTEKEVTNLKFKRLL